MCYTDACCSCECKASEGCGCDSKCRICTRLYDPSQSPTYPTICVGCHKVLRRADKEYISAVKHADSVMRRYEELSVADVTDHAVSYAVAACMAAEGRVLRAMTTLRKMERRM